MEKPLGGDKMAGVLQSYDILRNEKYLRLQNLKKVIERKG